MLAFDSIFKVLGKSKTDTEFSQLISSIGSPSRSYDAAGNKVFEFYEYGFGLCYGKKQKRFWMLSFEFASQHVQSGAMKPFEGEVYVGIASSDRVAEVESKLGMQSMTTRASNSSSIAKYDRDGYRITCIFSQLTGILETVTVELI